jgi:hypothetical protein
MKDEASNPDMRTTLPSFFGWCTPDLGRARIYRLLKNKVENRFEGRERIYPGRPRIPNPNPVSGSAAEVTSFV